MTTSSPIHSSQFYIYSLLFVVGFLEAEDMTEAGLRTSTFELWSTYIGNDKISLDNFQEMPDFWVYFVNITSQKLEDDCFTLLYIYHHYYLIFIIIIVLLF